MLRYLLPALLGIALPAQAAAPPDNASAAPEYPSASDVPVVLLVDLGSGQTLFRRNETQRFLPASVAKAMTALVAFELIEQGRLREDRRIAVRPETIAIWRGRGTTMPLSATDRPTVNELLYGVTIVSANDGAVVLAEGAAGNVAAWCGLMNRTAQRIGMTQSHFATPNGWPDGGRTYVSARDLAILSDELIGKHPKLYRRYFGRTEMTWNGVTQKNHDPTLGIVSGADGIKTGHTYEAGFNFLGSAQRGERRLVLVIAGTKHSHSRANAARELLEWGFAAWDSRPLVGTGQRVGEAQVQGGDVRHVALIAPRSFALALPKGQYPNVTTRIRYNGPLKAPIAKGATVAGLEVEIDGQPPHTLPLVAASGVGTAGPLDRLVNGLAGLFS
ncbi:MAG TPA: D-alanyl-D-alanine carboxypeptidase family protein [Novosphingobium sp.]|nr:D-alanyl-D-alanine carboxypeptidase family protein [Novosphingobium sp.]